ncbi:MAG: hypothetical protein JWP91_920 [Fibrobacteres bacterium]|nr:hypothetical protein [Fibrobacterota bacterium]
MSLTAVMLSFFTMVFSMEMWSRKHPPESLAAMAAAAAAKDSAEWVDRYAIPDSGAWLPEVGTYLTFVAESPHGGLIHNYVNNGFRHLTRAIMGVSNLNLRVGTVERMQISLGRYVDSLQAHPRWTLDPGKVRPAMLMAVEIMGSLNIPYDEATRDRIRKAQEAADSLESGQSTLWQRSKVQDFFIQSGYALVLMKERAVSVSPRPPEDGGKTAPTRLKGK